ncbi:hypothetical protein [Cellulomonas xiejunii]|uniref:hypothetical protein n=1 Tax=Cellulomonas xiejunii TaxID=2968083 RepID=UPI001D0E078B|nr:hypothetical protein [Cellulomonas xiejunii]
MASPPHRRRWTTWRCSHDVLLSQRTSRTDAIPPNAEPSSAAPSGSNPLHS